MWFSHNSKRVLSSGANFLFQCLDLGTKFNRLQTQETVEILWKTWRERNHIISSFFQIHCTFFSQFLDCQASKVNNEMWASHQYIVGKIFFIRMIVLFSNLQLSTIFRCRCPFSVWWCESKELTIGLRSAFLMHQWCTCNLFIRQVKKTCSH